MRVCQRTHQGLVRSSNQDSLLVDQGVFGVADDLHGHATGCFAAVVTANAVG